MDLTLHGSSAKRTRAENIMNRWLEVNKVHENNRKLTCVLGGVEEAMDLNEERPIGVWLDLHHVLGVVPCHRDGCVVGREEDLSEAALAYGRTKTQISGDRNEENKK